MPEQLQWSVSDAATAHLTVPIFMNGIQAQDYRPKDFAYWEAQNSTAYRNAWTGSIQGNSDWVQVVTWNDYSESTAIEPYTDASLAPVKGNGFYDLTGYYASWFVTGTQPKLTRDVLYFFHRGEAVTSAAYAQAQPAAIQAGKPTDQIELLSFLTAPGKLEIRIGDQSYTRAAGAGMSSLTIPLRSGTPWFSLARNGKKVIQFQGPQIYGPDGLPSGLQDLTYWSGSASASGLCSVSLP
jgi:hypothetical protein